MMHGDISPFNAECIDGVFSLTLDIDGEYCADIFAQREDEDFEGNGYDWESIATVYLNEKAPALIPFAEFDSEAGMFCVYFEEEGPFREFVSGFIAAVNDREVLADLFSRAEII
ncbi:MAG: immunity 51 family protein [Oscillospiraceae bacterium]|nr:immunity 51 family protein [Oscillospiraceae bacterium]